jgi:uncharacterized protein YjbI with pentapeptide repeats
MGYWIDRITGHDSELPTSLPGFAMLKKILLTSLLLSTTIVTVGTAARAENPNHLSQLLSTKECAKCNLVNAGLVLGELSGADLQQANLVGANLSQARLTGANLRGANLTGASLNGADLTGADLTGAILNSTDMRDSFLGGANLTGVNLQNAYIQGAVGLAATAGTADDFAKWGYAEWQKNNYRGSIEHFSQAIRLNPKMASAYYGRAMARYRLQDDAGATADASMAEQLYKQRGEMQSAANAGNFVKSIAIARQPTQPSQGGGGSFVDVITGVGSMLLKFF